MSTSTTTSLSPALIKAKDPQSYQPTTQSLEEIISIVQAGLRECRAANQSDFQDILKALAHGPFLCSTLEFKAHPSQRPIDIQAARNLLPSLAGADQRAVFPIYVMVDTPFWQAHISPSSHSSLAVIETSGCSEEYPQSFSHGHRMYALKMALEEESDSEILEHKSQILQIYGEDLQWVTYFIPACEGYLSSMCGCNSHCLSVLKDLLPSHFWITYTMIQNTTDSLQKGNNEAQSLASWLLHLHHLVSQLYHPLGLNTFSPAPLKPDQLQKLLTATKRSHLSGSVATIHGEQVLSHPQVLSALASGMAISALRNVFTKAVLKPIKESNYWVSSWLLSREVHMFANTFSSLSAPSCS